MSKIDPRVPFRIRKAEVTEINEVVQVIESLITELSGKNKVLSENAYIVCEKLITQELKGIILVASDQNKNLPLYGIITVGIREAIRNNGSYGIIEELWVHPRYRNLGIGKQLVGSVIEYCVNSGINRIEVGLPSSNFQSIEKTLLFYENNGFQKIGVRMFRNV